MTAPSITLVRTTDALYSEGNVFASSVSATLTSGALNDIDSLTLAGYVPGITTRRAASSIRS